MLGVRTHPNPPLNPILIGINVNNKKTYTLSTKNEKCVPFLPNFDKQLKRNKRTACSALDSNSKFLRFFQNLPLSSYATLASQFWNGIYLNIYIIYHHKNNFILTKCEALNRFIQQNVNADYYLKNSTSIYLEKVFKTKTSNLLNFI